MIVGIMVPEADGGAGLGMLERVLLQEGLSNVGIPLQSLIVEATTIAIVDINA